jgi:hypothetical protein
VDLVIDHQNFSYCHVVRPFHPLLVKINGRDISLIIIWSKLNLSRFFVLTGLALNFKNRSYCRFFQ